ncbi:MAG TPA: NADH-quinone oxidoreductase subunit C [Thermomicrobiales bacterium]|nr:NADH-quinone oxidoreductase subunit C [Thermomicrobiales bacterium]
MSARTGVPPTLEPRGNEHSLVPVADLATSCAAVGSLPGARLATMIGEDDRAASGAFRLSYVFALPGAAWHTVETLVDASAPEFPSVTRAIPAANWHEREVQDMLGLVAVGHPDPRRLVLHDDWPDDVYPLRKDFDSSQPVPRVEREPAIFHHLHGDGLVEIPVGPIHAGVIEPGHFRFAAVGEVIFNLETRLFYTHRGIEKLAEGKPAARVLQLAERVCGACSCSHGVSYAQAIEAIAGVPAPPRAAALRTLFLELERLYNHIGDIGNMCAGAAFAVGASFGAQLKEELQRLNERLTGNRFLHGVNRIGGVRRDLDAEGARDAERTILTVAEQFRTLIALLLESDTFVERLTATGIVPRETALALGAVGVAARASGVDVDSRRDHPHAFYASLPMPVPVVVRAEGDAKARMLLRIDEALASMAIVRAVLGTLPTGPLAVDLGPLPAGQSGFGVSESPRGENIHWVRTAADGTIERYRVRSASYPNWPVVAAAVPGNMVPDFPLINKSFELCYACLDR